MKSSLFTILISAQLVAVIWYRISAIQHTKRRHVAGSRDYWLSLRNGLLLIAIALTYVSIDLLRPERMPSYIVTIFTISGILLWIASLLFYIWSRNTLRIEFSPSVILYEKHQLITTGPYAFCRHPVYLSYIGSFVGSLLLTLSPATLIGGGIGVIWMLSRIAKEEDLLGREFGSAYSIYQENTALLFPRPNAIFRKAR